MSTPAFQKSYDFYKQLYENLKSIPKRDRFAWGERCEGMALDLLRILAKTGYAPRHAKRSLLQQASETIDLLKIFLRLGLELDIVVQKTYVARQAELQELGKMVGGWMKSS